LPGLRLQLLHQIATVKKLPSLDQQAVRDTVSADGRTADLVSFGSDARKLPGVLSEQGSFFYGFIYKIKGKISSILLHPHPASPVNGEESYFPPQAGGIKGGG